MDTQRLASLTRLSNESLVAKVKELAAAERLATVTLIAHLAEFDRRRLYLAEGCSSLFTYCTEVLRLSEPSAYRRIEAARAARRFPVILDLLADGSITLTTVCLLSDLLTSDNHRTVLHEARHRSKREVEELVARLRPRPDVPFLIRRFPSPPAARHAAVGDAVLAPDTSPSAPVEMAPAPAPAEVFPGSAGAFPAQAPAQTDADGNASAPPLILAPSRPAVIQPLAPGRLKVQFTASAEMCQKLRMAQALLRHQIPDGDPAAIIDRALTLLLESLTKRKLGAGAPRSSAPDTGACSAPSRYIPAEVRRAVWLRDGGRCAFIGANGRRCSERSFLEFHHVRPYSAGGPATVENLQLRCRAHNTYEYEANYRTQPSPERVDTEQHRTGARSVSTRPGAGVMATTGAAARPPGGESRWKPSGAGHRPGERQP